MFIIDSIDCESAWQDLLLHKGSTFVVDVEENVGEDVGEDVGVEEGVGEDDDVGVWVEVDDEVPLHVSLL